MVAKLAESLADSVTSAVSTRRRNDYVTPEGIAQDLDAVRRISRGTREAYVRRMKMRTIPPTSRREIERAVARVLQESSER